jgi:hypothetical protein
MFPMKRKTGSYLRGFLQVKNLKMLIYHYNLNNLFIIDLNKRIVEKYSNNLCHIY